MFGFFSKKQVNKTVIESSIQQIDNNGSLDVCFDFNCISKENKKERIYLNNWLKIDGDWVEEGQPIYSIIFESFMGSEAASSLIWATQDIFSKKSGILQIYKQKDELIQNSDKIYTIHPIGIYPNENSPLKESYKFRFDESKYKTAEKYQTQAIIINKWHKQSGQVVKKGEIILTLGFDKLFYNCNETIIHYAEKNGYLERVRTDTLLPLRQNEIIYIINEEDENRIKREFVNTPDINVDDFTGKKTIKWKQGGIISKSIDNKISLIFSLNNIDEKDFIIFQFYSKEIMLSKDDIVSFLFADNRIISFVINNSSYKASHPYIEKLFENKVQISDDELQYFEMQQFLKWKIILKKSNQEIIGGNDGSYENQSYKDFTIALKKFTKEYREIVRKEIPNYKPLLEREILKIRDGNNSSDECYIYLMIDTNNYYHKIGISNRPEWRERTLQSEKPTIEIIAYKKFVSRKMASSFEKALHNTYADKRIRGEWFQLDIKDIEEIKITLTT